MRFMRMLRSVSALLAMGFLAACPLDHHIEIANSNIDSLTLRFSRSERDPHPTLTDGLTVWRCQARGGAIEPEVVWRVTGKLQEVSVVRYGVVPAGFQEVVRAKALNDSCFTVWTTHVKVQLSVDKNRRVSIVDRR